MCGVNGCLPNWPFLLRYNFSLYLMVTQQFLALRQISQVIKNKINLKVTTEQSLKLVVDCYVPFSYFKGNLQG
jgi:hypothetical protein